MIILFEGARQVIKADKLCRSEGFDVAIVPVPEKYSSECGMCLRVNSSRCSVIAELLDIKAINYRIEDE